MELLNEFARTVMTDPVWLQVIQAMQLPVVALLTFFMANSVTRAMAVQPDITPKMSGIINKKNPVAFLSIGFAFNFLYLLLNLFKVHYYVKPEEVPHGLSLSIYASNIATGCCFYLQSLPSFLLHDELDRSRKWMMYVITIILTTFIAAVFDEYGFVIALFNLSAYFLASAYVYRLQRKYRSARGSIAVVVILSGWTIWTALQILRAFLTLFVIPEPTVDLIGFAASLVAKCLILFGIYYFSIGVARNAYLELNEKVKQTTSLQRIIRFVNNASSIDELARSTVRELVAGSQFGFHYAIFWEVDHVGGVVLNRESAVGNDIVNSPQQWGADGYRLDGGHLIVRAARNRQVIRLTGDKIGAATIDLAAPNPPLDKKEFERFGQKNLSRAFIPVKRVEPGRSSRNDPASVIAVIEVGYVAPDGVPLEVALPPVHSELDIYLDNVAEIYGRLFDQTVDKEVDAALHLCNENAKDDHGAYINAVLAAASRLTRSDICILVIAADPYLPQFFSFTNGTQDRRALNRLEKVVHEGAGITAITLAELLGLVQKAFPDHAVHNEDLKSANRLPKGWLLTLSSNSAHFNNVVRSMLARIAESIPAPFNEKKFHNAVAALVTKENVAADLDGVMEPILNSLRGYFATPYIWIWLRTSSGFYEPLSAMGRSSPPFPVSLKGKGDAMAQPVEGPVRIMRIDPEVNDFPDQTFGFVRRHNIKTLIRQEFRAQHQTLGFVDVAYTNEIAELTYEEANFLKLIEIKASASIQLHNIIRSFRDISDTLAQSDLDGTLSTITRSALAVLGADPVLLYKSANGKDVYFRDVTYSTKEAFRDESILKVFSSEPDAHAELPEMILGDRTCFFSDESEFRSYLRRHTKVHEKVFFKKDFWAREEIASMAAVRLEYRSVNYVKPIGALFINFRRPVEFTSELKKLIGTFADLAAASIHQAMVSEQSRRFVLSNLRLNRPILLEALGHGALHNAKKAFDTIRSLYLNILEKIDTHADTDAKRPSAVMIRTQLEGLREPFTLLHGRFVDLKKRYSPEEPLVLGVHGIKGIVEQQLDATRAEFHHLNVKVTRDMPEREIRIECDRGQIGLALLNIMKNAYQAISIRGELSVLLREFEDQVRIDITDNGRGISEEMRDVMFQPNITDKPDGTGLGLSMSKYVIETGHNGKVHGRTSNGKTTFSIFLPKTQPAGSVEPPKPGAKL